MKSQKQLAKELEEKDKVLQFLRQKYEEDTGKKLEVPLSWATFFSGAQDQPKGSLAKDTQSPLVTEATGEKYALEAEKTEADNFISKVHDLNLPQAPYQKKTKTTGSTTSASTSSKAAKAMMRQLKDSVKKQPELKFYLLEEIDLSGYERKGFNKASFQELLKGISNLVSIRKVLLRANGITDECSAEVCELLKNPKIRYLDFSCNKLAKPSGQSLAQALSETSHLVCISSNEFSNDYTSSRAIITALKGHTSLFHLGITLSEKSSDLLFSTLFGRGTTEKSINSLNLRDSAFSSRAFNSLTQLLLPPKPKSVDLYHITALSFKHCFLSPEMIDKLAKAVQLNRTLVKLDLSSNGLKCDQGAQIVQALKNNITLVFLDLSTNYLKDRFAFELSAVLKTNKVLYEVNIANNQITQRGGAALHDVLIQYNGTLVSLGDLRSSQNMGVRLKEEIRQCLLINALPKELKKERLEGSEITRVRGGESGGKVDKVVDKENLSKLKELEYVILGKSIYREDDDRDVWKIY